VNSVGRNELRPCGSGLKFKKCCLNRTAAAPKSYSPVDRGEALLKLIRFATGSEFTAPYSAAFQLFWGDWLSEEPDEELRDVMTSETANLAFHSWFAFDFDLGDGRTAFDPVLCERGQETKRRRAQLPPRYARQSSPALRDS
jgi:hypothetical protein